MTGKIRRIRTAEKGSGKMASHKYSKEEIAEWRETHGKVLYFHTDATNFVVPKAYTFGWTFNWAHPAAWVVGAAIVALLVYSIFFSERA
jgi:uncharacterized membrane protein